MLAEPPIFVRGELELERIDDDPGQPLLEGEDVLDVSVVFVGPEVMVGASIDERAVMRTPPPLPAHVAFHRHHVYKRRRAAGARMFGRRQVLALLQPHTPAELRSPPTM